MSKRKIIHNRCQCAKCGDIIESKHVHDYVTCKCGAIAVDGGHEYLRRCGDFHDMIEMNEIIEVEEVEAPEIAATINKDWIYQFCKEWNS